MNRSKVIKHCQMNQKFVKKLIYFHTGVMQFERKNLLKPLQMNLSTTYDFLIRR